MPGKPSSHNERLAAQLILKLARKADPLYPIQREIVRRAKRYNVLALGRRAGKTVLGIHLSRSTLRQGLPVGWFAPNYKLMLDVWRDSKKILQPWLVKASRQEMRMELSNGGVFEFWTMEDEDAGRGRKYARAIFDEAAISPRLETIWTSAVRPTLTDYRGDAWFLSSPKGRNYFHTLFAMGEDPLRKDWISWQLPTSVNPYISKDELIEVKGLLPFDVFGQEYLAKFLDKLTSVFKDIVDKARASYQSHAIAGHRYVMGVDWAKQNDFTVLSIIDTAERVNSLVYVERFNQIDYHFQLRKLKAVCERFKPYKILAEANSMGEPLIDMLLSQGYPIEGFYTSPLSKRNMIEELSLALENDRLWLYPDPVVINELEAYEVSRVAGGTTIKYGAPSGFHDDTVMSLGLANLAALQSTGFAQQTYI